MDRIRRKKVRDLPEDMISFIKCYFLKYVRAGLHRIYGLNVRHGLCPQVCLDEEAAVVEKIVLDVEPFSLTQLPAHRWEELAGVLALSLDEITIKGVYEELADQYNQFLWDIKRNSIGNRLLKVRAVWVYYVSSDEYDLPDLDSE